MNHRLRRNGALVCTLIACALGCTRAPKPAPPASLPAAGPSRAAADHTTPNADKNVDQLLNELGASDPAIANSVIEALAARGKQDPAVAKRILNALYSEDDLQSSDAAEALAKIADPAMLPDIIVALHDPRARAGAQTVLKRIVNKDNLPALIPLVTDPDSHVRHIAIDLLASVGGDMAQTALLSGLHHKDYRTRRHIASALGDLGDKTAAPALVDLLADPSPQVTDEAARALRKLSGKNFGFKPFDPPDTRAKAIEAWRKWAKANH